MFLVAALSDCEGSKYVHYILFKGLYFRNVFTGKVKRCKWLIRCDKSPIPPALGQPHPYRPSPYLLPREAGEEEVVPAFLPPPPVSGLSRGVGED